MILRVALDVPLPKLFDYRAEDATRGDVGCRVLVPFGQKRVVGLIVEVATDSEIPASRLRPAEKILRDVAPLGREWLELAKFCSRYYQRPFGEVVATAPPPRLRSPQALSAAPVAYRVTPAGTDALKAIPIRQRHLRGLLARLSEGPATASELEPHARGARKLLERGLAAG